MSVIPITVFFSLALAGLFVVLFAREQLRRRCSSPERESLLPLADELPRISAATAHRHDHGNHHCGCKDGSRPPCAGCVKHSATATP